MKRIVLSYGKGRNFPEGLRRLKLGLEVNGYSGDMRLLGALPDGVPDQDEVPYAFKPELMTLAAEEGYEQILWADAACVPVKPLDRLWYELGRDGCLFQSSFWSIGEWTSDAALQQLGVTREQAIAMKPSLWSCVVGLDITHEMTRRFLEAWLAASRDGVSFPGQWENTLGEVSADPRVKGHRHDQSVATILAYKFRLPFHQNLVSYDVWNIMPLEPRDDQLRLPWVPAYFLSNHNTKELGLAGEKPPMREVVYP